MYDCLQKWHATLESYPERKVLERCYTGVYFSNPLKSAHRYIFVALACKDNSYNNVCAPIKDKSART